MQNGFLTAPNTRTDYVYLAKPEEGLNHIVEFSASTLKGTVKITRSKALAGVACMLGSMIRVR